MTVLIWKSYGDIKVYHVERTPDSMDKLKKLIKSSTEKWNLDYTDLDEVKTLQGINDWVHAYCDGHEQFEYFSFSSLFALE